MKKKLFALLPLLGLSTTLLIASCGNKTNSEKDNNDNNQTDNGTNLPSSEVIQDNLGDLQTVTGMNLISFFSNSASQMSTLSTSNSRFDALRDDFNNISDEEKNEIKEVLPTLDLLLLNDTAFESTISEVNQVIEGNTYQYLEKINYQDNYLNTSTISLYFNITNSYMNRGNNFQTLEGIAYVNEDLTAYRFTSITKEESSWDEEESERLFRIELNNNSYIMVEEESENEFAEKETEFTYTVVNNGRLESHYSIEIEDEWGKKAVSYEINEKEYEMHIVNHNGQEVYVVEYENESGWNEVEATLFFVKKMVNNQVYFEEIFF